MKDVSQYFNTANIKLMTSLGVIIVTVTLWGAKLDGKMDLLQAGQNTINGQFKENTKSVNGKLDDLQKQVNDNSKEVAVLRQALKDRNLIAAANQIAPTPKVQFAYAYIPPLATPTPTPTQQQVFKSERDMAKAILKNFFGLK